MMENRKILSTIFGITQGALGALSAALAAMLFFNLLEVQAVFNVAPEFLPFCLLILGLFSVFSIISGSFLIRERWRQT
jgi:membrane associated rhomboid family serine protease